MFYCLGLLTFGLEGILGKIGVKDSRFNVIFEIVSSLTVFSILFGSPKVNKCF